MIFATVGTQVHKFNRFIDIVNQITNEEVILQYGISDVIKKINNITYYDFIENIDDTMSNADIIITHGGVGSIMDGLKKQKKIIVIAREKRYSEHVNDHQLEITDKLSEAGYIYKFNETDDINNIINKIKRNEITFKQYIFDNTQLIDNLINDIK